MASTGLPVLAFTSPATILRIMGSPVGQVLYTGSGLRLAQGCRE
jgi:hypothetical protein